MSYNIHYILYIYIHNIIIHTLSLKISSAAKRMSPLALPLFITGYQSSFGVTSSSGINFTRGEQTLLPRNSSLPCNQKIVIIVVTVKYDRNNNNNKYNQHKKLSHTTWSLSNSSITTLGGFSATVCGSP